MNVCLLLLSGFWFSPPCGEEVPRSFPRKSLMPYALVRAPLRGGEGSLAVCGPLLVLMEPSEGALSPSSSASPQEPQQPTITNVFQDTDIRQALADIAASANVVIVPDETVQGTVSCDLRDVPLEQALTIITAPGGFSWVKEKGYYLVGRAHPSNPNFLRFAKTTIYKPNYSTAERIASLLPTPMKDYVQHSANDRVLTITASPEMTERILRDIRILDTPPPRIILEALVTEVSTETLDQFDFSWTWKHFGLDTTNESIQLRYTKATQSDVANMKFLISRGKAEVRANPRIMALEGQEAMIEVAQENYFQVVTGPVNFPYVTIQLIKTGISLKMTPFLADDGQITVRLSPEVSDATGTGPAGLPINTARRAMTTVRVKEGETIIIGGMSFESKRRRTSRVPILSELPLVGALFRFHKTETRQTEVVIMVTPRVIREEGTQGEP
jgi:type II secretory pathway component GspD/PulD (secretin)